MVGVGWRVGQKFGWAMAFFLTVPSVLAEDEGQRPSLILSTNIAPPYQIETAEGQLTGIAVERMDCILSQMGWDFTTRVVPWKRAQRDVETEHSQGYYSAAHLDALDQHATLSSPLILEKWYWYATDKSLLKWNTETKAKRLVGVILGANTEAWLDQHDFKRYRTFQDARQLVGSLLLGRLDLFLADQHTIREVMQAWPEAERSKIHSRFSRYTPLGAYWSHTFLQKHPAFMDEFNHTISLCAPEQRQLDARERAHFLAAVLPFLERRLDLSRVGQLIGAPRREWLSSDAIEKLDQQWSDERRAASKPLISAVEQSTLSALLQNFQQSLDGVVEEVFVMDAQGLIVGMSEPTSDYWQGDEAKFQQTYAVATREPHISSIEFDESTRAFQVQVSRAVFDISGKIPLGAITYGIDVEKALSFEP